MAKKSSRRDTKGKGPGPGVGQVDAAGGHEAPPAAADAEPAPDRSASGPEAPPVPGLSSLPVEPGSSPGVDADGAAAALADDAQDSRSKTVAQSGRESGVYDGWTANRLLRRSTPPPMPFPGVATGQIQAKPVTDSIQPTPQGSGTATEPTSAATEPTSAAAEPTSAATEPTSAAAEPTEVATGSPAEFVLEGIPPPPLMPSGVASDIPQPPTCGDAWDLVERSSIAGISARPAGRPDLVEEMEELYALDDFTGALRVAELLLGVQPDHPQAQRCAHNSRRRLEQLYASKIGPLSQVPVVCLKDADIRWLGLDHRAGFVLSRIDDRANVDELLDVCGMPRLEALKTIIELINQGAVRLEKG